MFWLNSLLLAGTFIFTVLAISASMVLATTHDTTPAPLPSFWRTGINGGLFVMDLNRRMMERVVLPPTLQIVDVPRLSSDGHRLVYEGMEEGRLRIYAQEAAQTLYVTHPGIEDRLPGWSMDGSRLALWSNRISPASGSRWQNWNFFIIDLGQSLTRQMTNELGCQPYNNPSWSPDDRWIVAQFWCSGGENGMYILNVETGALSSIRNFVDAGGDLVWSPTGERLAFRTNRDQNGEVYILELSSSAVQNLTQNPATDFQPAWSPDGAQIAFVSTRDGAGEIYVMDSDGSNIRRLTYGGGWLPSWSPDGKWIGYLSDRDGGNALYLVAEDGRESVYVVETESQLFLGWFQ